MAIRTIKQTRRRVRTKTTDETPKKFTPAIISSIAATAADTIQNTRVMPVRLPGFTAGASAAETVTAMTAISETVIELTFTGDVQGTDLIVKEGDPGIRTSAAGFVPAGSYAIGTFP